MNIHHSSKKFRNFLVKFASWLYFTTVHSMNYERFQHDIDGTKKSIFLVNMTKEITPYFSQLAIQGIEKYLKQGKKIWILVNKKGYSGGIICHDCGHIPKCKNCDVSISITRSNREKLSDFVISAKRSIMCLRPALPVMDTR